MVLCVHYYGHTPLVFSGHPGTCFIAISCLPCPNQLISRHSQKYIKFQVSMCWVLESLMNFGIILDKMANFVLFFIVVITVPLINKLTIIHM